MSVSNQTNKVRYDGDNSTVDFDFSFKVFSEEDLEVYLIDTSVTPNVSVLQVLNVDYTVEVLTETEGGTVTMNTAPVATDDLLITRILEYTQPTVIPTESNIPEKQLENTYDKNTMLIQQVKEITNRTAKVPITSEATDIELPGPEDGKAILWDGTSGAMKNSTDLFDDIVTNATAAQTAAEAAQSAAETAQTAAELAEANAETSETNAAASAAAALVSENNAASTLASAIFRDVVYYTDADSPITLTQADNGKLLHLDSSGGPITINLPEISGIVLPLNFTFFLETAGNTVTINRAGTDTILGLTSKSLTIANSGFHLIADDTASPDEWTYLDFGNLGTASLSIQSKTADYTVLNSDDVILVDAISNDVSITLPSPASNVGGVKKVKRTDDGFLRKRATFIDANVTVGTDNIAITSHPFIDLQKIRLTTTGTLPTGLALATDYWVIYIDANNIKLASSLANAITDTSVDITAAAGGGTHTVRSERTTLTVVGTIDGVSNKTLASKNELIEVVANSTQWNITQKHIPEEVINFQGITTGLTGGSSTITGKMYRSNGPFVEFMIDAVWSTIFTGGTPTFELPFGLVINTSDYPQVPTTDNNLLGRAMLVDTTGTDLRGTVLYNSTTSIIVYYDSTFNGNVFMSDAVVTTAQPFTWANNDEIRMTFRVPIVGMV